MNKRSFSLILIYFLTSLLSANDIRTLAINSDMHTLSDRGYVNFKCKFGNKKISSWKEFNKCMISNDDTYYINLEYDEKFVMLDHDDLFSNIKKNNEEPSMFQVYIKKLMDKCKENNVALLRTVGVIFSDDEKRETQYIK